MNPAAVAPSTSDNLALLYQGLLTSIVRVRSGSQPISNCDEFRRRTQEVLVGVEHEANRLGYLPEDVSNTNYAIVAFLDESILDSNDPSRNLWSSLHAQMYGEAVAGERFFDQLDMLRNRRDSPQLADVLEVHYLCLLLGYRGRYAGYARERAGELNRIMDDLKARIEGVRGRDLLLWPGMTPGLPERAAAPPVDSAARRLRLQAIISIGGLVLLWLLCTLALSIQARYIQSNLSQ